MATFEDERMLELLRKIDKYIKSGDTKSASNFIGLIITAIEEED